MGTKTFSSSRKNMLSWAHIGLAGSFVALLVVGFGAQAVSRKTPTYFMAIFQEKPVILLESDHEYKNNKQKYVDSVGGCAYSPSQD